MLSDSCFELKEAIRKGTDLEAAVKAFCEDVVHYDEEPFHYDHAINRRLYELDLECYHKLRCGQDADLKELMRAAELVRMYHDAACFDESVKLFVDKETRRIMLQKIITIEV
jgi:hypothetical protein